jgi:hypothetical protein
MKLNDWYINRLKTMSAPEVVFRVSQFAQKKYEQRFRKGFNPPVELKRWPLSILPIVNEPLNVSENNFEIFGIPFDYSGEINWHQDIQTGNCFPLDFSKSINVRKTEGISAKIVWEVNRLQFLSLIALRYRNCKDEKFIQLFKSIVESWIDNNPYLVGINWYSNIEVNLRLITFFLSWEILDINRICKIDKEFHDFVVNKFIPAIYLHCQYSYQNPSKFSSANNHLISEYAGLYIASSFWSFKESFKWRQYSKIGLEREILKQHSHNGINKEEAAEYIQFITDFFLLSLIVGENTSDSFSEAYKSRLHNIIKYIADFLDIESNFPNYGDEDDGKTIVLSNADDFSNFKSIIISGAVLFNDPSLKIANYCFDVKNHILLGDTGFQSFGKMETKNKNLTSSFYHEEGHYLLRKHCGNDKEIYMHFDAAPLGFLSIAAHGHADCLSFLLNIDGKPFLIDSGTYTYHTETNYRSYFIGTLAHNTVCIDNTNQAKMGGPTLWLNHYKAKTHVVESNSTYDLIEASHNGYEHIGARHKRNVYFDKVNNYFEITDLVTITDGKLHSIEIPFHIHPECEIIKEKANIYRIRRNNAQSITLELDTQLDNSIIRGSEYPLLGWYSKSFLQKEPTNVLYCKIESSNNLEFKTIIKILD